MEMSPFFFGVYKFVKYGVYPLTWVLVCFGSALLLAWLPSSPRRRRWLRRALVIGVCWLLLVSAPMTSYAVMSLLEGWYPAPHPGDGPFDAIVVLGGGIRDQGTLRPLVELSDESQHRTWCGVEWYHRHAASTLVMTGGDGRVFGVGAREAPAMKDAAIRLGVPPDAVLIDDAARTTYENALGTKQVLGSGKHILLVTSAYHIPRAVALFAKQGFTVTPAPCGFHARNRLEDLWRGVTLFEVLPTSRGLQRTTDALEELAGMAVYWLAGKL